ncbi:MAG: hypothetical protein DUD31_08050 [Coriobacteriaceae bacterium]|nr:MAG: hypothetical protein DUD31_08050 [Coriobacteriaceae bacterium]
MDVLDKKDSHAFSWLKRRWQAWNCLENLAAVIQYFCLREMGHRADRRGLAFWGAGGAACLSVIWQAASIQLHAAWMSENGENIAGMRLWLQLAHGNVTSLRDA